MTVSGIVTGPKALQKKSTFELRDAHWQLLPARAVGGVLRLGLHADGVKESRAAEERLGGEPVAYTHNRSE